MLRTKDASQGFKDAHGFLDGGTGITCQEGLFFTREVHGNIVTSVGGEWRMGKQGIRKPGNDVPWYQVSGIRYKIIEKTHDLQASCY
jgi:hypothetical protein